MIKLIHILKESILSEKIIKIPPEVLKNAEKVFNHITNEVVRRKNTRQKDFWNNKIKSDSLPGGGYKVPENLNFNFKNLKGRDIEVKTILFNNKDEQVEGYAVTSLKDLEEGKPLELWINMGEEVIGIFSKYILNDSFCLFINFSISDIRPSDISIDVLAIFFIFLTNENLISGKKYFFIK